MQTLTQQLHQHYIAIRKNAELKHLGPFMALVISECERVGKDNGNRESTDDEVQKVITKITKSINETITHATDLVVISAQTEQRDYIAQFLPQLVSEDVLRDFILANCTNMNMGQVMGAVKNKFGANADMKVAAQIISNK